MSPNGNDPWWFRANNIVSLYAYDTFYGGTLCYSVSQNVGANSQIWFDGAATIMNNNNIAYVGGYANAGGPAVYPAGGSNPSGNMSVEPNHDQ